MLGLKGNAGPRTYSTGYSCCHYRHCSHTERLTKILVTSYYNLFKLIIAKFNSVSILGNTFPRMLTFNLLTVTRTANSKFHHHLQFAR